MGGKRRASISIVLLAGLIVLMGGASVVAMMVNGKFNINQHYQRIADRYITESGIDLALGLLENYLDNQTYVMQYTKTDAGSFSVNDEFSPYLLDDIRTAPVGEFVTLDLINSATNDYLSSVGFKGFNNGGVVLRVNTFYDNDYFKISQMCITPDFYATSAAAESDINPVYLNCQVDYRGGQILATIVLRGIKVVRPALDGTLAVGEAASVEIGVDTSEMEVIFDTYQNFRT